MNAQVGDRVVVPCFGLVAKCAHATEDVHERLLLRRRCGQQHGDLLAKIL